MRPVTVLFDIARAMAEEVEVGSPLLLPLVTFVIDIVEVLKRGEVSSDDALLLISSLLSSVVGMKN